MKRLTVPTFQCELQALGYRLLNRLDPFKFRAISEKALALEKMGKLRPCEFACGRARNVLINLLQELDRIGWETIKGEWQPAEATSWSLFCGVTTTQIRAPLRRDTISNLIAACPC